VRRVLLVSTYYWPVIGGVETNARQLAAVLRRGGFAPEVLTRRSPSTAPRFEVVDGVPVRRLGPGGERTGRGKWVWLPSLFLALLRRGRGAHALFNIDLRATGLAVVGAGRLLRCPVILQAATPDALSGHHWDAALRRVPGLGAAGRTWLKRVMHGPYRAADAYTCVARAFRDEGLHAGIAPERLHYTPHFVDIEQFQPAAAEERWQLRDALGWPREALVVVFVGRLSREKGVLDLIQAWARVGNRDAYLVLVGPEDAAHALGVGREARHEVEALGLADRIQFAGATDDPRPFLRAADLAVQPSHYEAFGLAALEAMACGLPVVASDVGGLRDFVRPGQTGVLVAPRDNAALASALASLLGDADARADLGRRARAVVVAEFSQEVIGARYLDILSRITVSR